MVASTHLNKYQSNWIISPGTGEKKYCLNTAHLCFKLASNRSRSLIERFNERIANDTQDPGAKGYSYTTNLKFQQITSSSTPECAKSQKNMAKSQKGKDNVPRPLFLFGFYPFIVPSSKAWPVQRDNLKNAPANSVECKTWLSHLVFKLNQSCYSLDTWQHIDANMYMVYGIRVYAWSI